MDGMVSHICISVYRLLIMAVSPLEFMGNFFNVVSAKSIKRRDDDFMFEYLFGEAKSPVQDLVRYILLLVIYCMLIFILFMLIYIGR